MDLNRHLEILMLEKTRLEKDINQMLMKKSVNNKKTEQLDPETPCCSNSFKKPGDFIKLPGSPVTPNHDSQLPVESPVVQKEQSQCGVENWQKDRAMVQVGDAILEKKRLQELNETLAKRIADLEEVTLLQKQQIAQLEEDKVILETRVQEILSVNRQKKYEVQSLGEVIGRLKNQLINLKGDLEKSHLENQQMRVTLATLEMENANLSRLHEQTMEEQQSCTPDNMLVKERMRLEMWEQLLQEKEAMIAKEKEDMETKLSMLMKDKEDNRKLLEQNGNLIKLSQCYQTLSSLQTVTASRMIQPLPALLPASSSSLGCEGFLPMPSQLFNLGRQPCVLMPLGNFAELKIRADVPSGRSSYLMPATEETPARQKPVQEVATLSEASIQTAANAVTKGKNIKEEKVSPPARGRESVQKEK